MGSDDIWSRVAASATPVPELPEEWLIRHQGQLLGPLSTITIANKLLVGAFDGDSLVAPEGGEDFVPLRQVASFQPHVLKAEKLRAARGRRRLVLGLVLGLLLLAGAAGGGGWWAMKKGLIGPKSPAAIAAANRGKNVSLKDIPQLKLVALVDLDKAQAGLQIRGRKPKRVPQPGDKPTPGKDPDELEGPVGCQLEQDEIFAVVKRSLPKWLVCVQNLAETEPDAVPDKLNLAFTVTTSGELTDFQILNRPLRKGPFRNCMFKFFTEMRFPKSKGSNCTVDDWPIPLKR